ncbi:hypothetical protein ACLKA6_004545 [Drosophila palustris]
MDETWIHHYIPESNRSSAEWREAGESRSKRVNASRWAAAASPDDPKRNKTIAAGIIADEFHYCLELRLCDSQHLEKPILI